MAETATMKLEDGGDYTGAVKSEKPHGNGKCTWADGSVYEGDWKNGKMHGKGTYIAGQTMYTGQFFKGNPEGKGKFVVKLPRGELVYEGEMISGEPDGQGKETLPNGDEYVGSLQRGAATGPAR